MALNKFDTESDGIADTYRAAFYLAKGAEETAGDFLKKAKKKLRRKLIEIPADLKSRRKQLFWAEKILDQYLKLKHS